MVFEGRDPRWFVRSLVGAGRIAAGFAPRKAVLGRPLLTTKDVQTLKKLCTSQGKLFSRKRSGNCAAFQRAVKDAVKRARFMALMPYVGE
jgi:ribosomal protein S18